MADIRALTTVRAPIDAGGVHTRSLTVSAGQPILDALQDASCHLATALDALWPIALNYKADEESPYPAIISGAIAKALIDSVQAAIEQANREAENE
ncbi:hypothetical protein [Trinickia fusca]|nr:hypothetical protein [Trinickia fusca]